MNNFQQQIHEAFDKFNQMTIMVIGDVMVDSYLWGKVERISPEAPVPILSGTGREDRLGGAANVVLNLKALGAKPITCSVIGLDETGDIFKRRMQANELTEIGLLQMEDRITTRKTRLIGSKQQLLRVDEEDSSPLKPDQQAQFLNHCLAILQHQTVDAIIFEDYDKGVVNPLLIEAIVHTAEKKAIPVLVDPKKRNFLSYNGVTLFKPNFKELVEGLNITLRKGDFEGLHQAVQLLHTRYNQQYVLVTLSELGVFISEKERYTVIPAQLREIADVSGAGDTVISITTVALVAGLLPNVVAALANLGGGLVCEKVGVVPINKPKLLEEALKLSF